MIQVVLYRIPVLGWFIRDAFEGAPDAEYFFYANVVLLAILGNYLVGQISLVLIAPLIVGVVLLAFKRARTPAPQAHLLVIRTAIASMRRSVADREA